LELNEVGIETLENLQVAGSISQLLVHLTPLKIIKPGCGIWLLLNLSTRTGKEESPLLLINFVISEHNLGTK
jgi:hypothetical protein